MSRTFTKRGTVTCEPINTWAKKKANRRLRHYIKHVPLVDGDIDITPRSVNKLAMYVFQTWDIRDFSSYVAEGCRKNHLFYGRKWVDHFDPNDPDDLYALEQALADPDNETWRTTLVLAKRLNLI